MKPIARRLARVVVSAMVITVFSAGPAGSVIPETWYAPSSLNGRVFPVLLSPEGSWLNWRNTFGAPRMRFNERTGTWQQTGTHQGIDIYAERGAPVVSIGPGVIENVGWTFYSGYRVGVRGDDGRYYFYAHLLPQQTPGIVAGARVAAGRRIGSLGSSGYGPVGTADEFPPHLHFGLQLGNGSWVDAHPMLVELYRHQVSAVKATRASADALGLEIRALRRRAYGPAAPPTKELAERVATVQTQRAKILSEAVLAG